VESFFQICGSFDAIEIKELLLYRYHNIEYILNLDLAEGIEFIEKAKEEKDLQKFWQMYLVKFQWMGPDDYIPFDDYLSQIKGKNISTVSKEEALAKAEEIEAKARAKRGV
jgi:hypothetical protein